MEKRRFGTRNSVKKSLENKGFPESRGKPPRQHTRAMFALETQTLRSPARWRYALLEGSGVSDWLAHHLANERPTRRSKEAG